MKLIMQLSSVSCYFLSLKSKCSPQHAVLTPPIYITMETSFITLLTRAHQWILSWANWIQST